MGRKNHLDFSTLKIFVGKWSSSYKTTIKKHAEWIFASQKETVCVLDVIESALDFRWFWSGIGRIPKK